MECTSCYSLFWPEDWEFIFQIPLSFSKEMDVMVWHHSNSGIFSVYHLALSMASPASSSFEKHWPSKVWRDVWQEKIPNKVKVFSWRAIRGIRRTATCLQQHLPPGPLLLPVLWHC
ncbi:UNVERIFIED_CONTAM: hypothetical protein Sradi_6215700 [Sesamum radiatum]|uniref:Reverse transcriptase zinc-binding domain-containing protein n=1 Tax=Sesamum radiatum TaxID=300843 RepID=A0AAW2KBK0_SESRA